MDIPTIIISFVLGLITEYSYNKLSFIFRIKKREQLSSILKNSNDWTSNNGELYFYEKEPEYKIEINDGYDALAEKYKKFPDREHDRISWVEVKYNEATLFGWNFMYLDGYRLLVPVPEVEYDNNGDVYDYYDLSSTQIKIFSIIGRADLMGESSKIEGLKSVARMLGVTITKL